MVNDTPELNIDRLPLILAGPILRHTTTEIVTVWVALRLPARVSLQVYRTENRGQTIGQPIASGNRKTVTVGASLHIVTVTATNPDGKTLARGEIYAYNLEFTLGEDTHSLSAALSSAEYPSVRISYFRHQLPTFVLPPLDLDRVKIAHGSCRKPHGDGQDALAILDRLLAVNAGTPDLRPQQLFMTGDQIYGDDVADPLLWVATHLGEAILGWEEELPVGTWAESAYLTPKELPSGKRGEIATGVGGFTAGLEHRQRSKVTSHLFGLGEYCAAYLLAWSPIVWPKKIPDSAQMNCADREIAQSWDREVIDMQNFISSLWAVRRVLANTITYAIFDDHDVSDDWNLNQDWCLRVLGKPLGRRVVSNALFAYSLFQAWGNTPTQFEPGTNGYRLFGLLEELIHTRGYDELIEQEIGRYIGLPPRDSQSNLPVFTIDGEDLILARDPQAIDWHYTLDCGGYLAIICDTRTHRGYPQAATTAAPRLLSKSGLKTQIANYLNDDRYQDREILIVLPTNLFGLQAIDWVHHHQIKKGKIFATDVGDAWNIRLDAVAELLDAIHRTRDRAIVLTGDIHYAGAMEFSYRSIDGNPTQIVQFTASACKNEEMLTRILQSKLKTWFLPELMRTCIGTFAPAKMVWQPLLWPSLRRNFRPDWRGKLRLVRSKSITIDKNSSIGNNICMRLYRPLRSYFYHGGEVIGFNNIAIVSWHRKHPQSIVRQDVYWIDRAKLSSLTQPIAMCVDAGVIC
jgi:hypothetical protein